MSTLLTIAIPTFNRADHLDALLESLSEQIKAFQDDIRLVVIDNHSTDDTALRCETWKQKGLTFDYICNAENIGMAGNIIKCFEIAETEYSWTIGDDDKVRSGMLAQVMEVLRREHPDLLHFVGQTFNPASAASQRSAPKLTPRTVDARAFVRLVHVHITFISCLILRKATRAACDKIAPLERYPGCVIPQLIWILEILRAGHRFTYVPQPLILGRDSGAEGYRACQTFSTEIVEILDAGVCAKLANAFKTRIVIKYLPSTVLKLRQRKFGASGLSDMDAWCLNRAYSRFVGYWLFLVPMVRLPLWPAKIAFLLSRLTGNCIAVLDRIDIYVFRLHR